MKKRFFSVFCLLLTLLLASCDLLGGSLSEYVTEYTQNAALELYEVPETFPRDATQTACIDNPFPITLYLRNPMKYQIVFEYTFKNTSIQTLYDTQFKQTNPIQYVPVATDLSAYNMIFPAEFIEAIDTGAGSGSDPKDISGTVNAFDKETLRPFGSLDLTLRADTAPMSVCNGLMQLDRDPSENDPLYILCFEIPHSARNNDFDTIKINNNTWKIEYDASRDSIPNGIKVTPYGGNRGELIANPSKKDNPDTPAVKTYPLETGSVDVFEPSDPASFDTFYYITYDKQTDTETLYQITITDKAGLSTTCTLSNKAEKLAQPSITNQAPAFGNVYIAGIYNTLPVTIMPASMTTTGTPVTRSTFTYTVEIVDENGTPVSEDVLKENGELPCYEEIENGLVLYPNKVKEHSYRITARSKCTGFLASDETVSNVLHVIRSNHFFVAHSFEGTDDYNDGTFSYPYYSFSKCMEEIVDYQRYLEENGYNSVLADGFYIDVKEDYNVTGSDDVFNSSYLINNKIDDSTTFSGKLTIQGVDDNGNPLSGKSKRTVDGGQCCSFISWDGSNLTLTLRDLTLQKFSNSSSGGCIRINMTQKQNSIVTIERCDITNNTTGNQGGGIWIQGGGGTNTRVTVKDCNITYNTATMGAGVHITYGGPDPSDELYVIDGNTTISNNTAVSDGGGLFICNKVEIASTNVKIIDNTSGQGGLGAGVYFGGGSLSLKGGTITGNKVKGDSEIPSNLYIYSGMRLSVTGNLSGSKIGVTTANQPAVGEPIPFVDGWQASYGQPANFFTSDKGCGITTDGSGTPVLAVNSGTGGYHFTEDVTISVSSDNYIPGVEKQITVSASLDGAEPVDITNDVTSWHLELTENGETIPTSWYSVSGRTLTLKQALPRNTYTLYIDIVYNGRHYSDSIAITPPPSIASLTAVPVSGAVAASTASDFARLATWVSGGSSLENVTVLLDSDVTLPADYTGIGFITTENAMRSFSGTFDGQGHTVTLDITSDETKRTLGLFGCIKSAHIKNVKVTGLITSNDTSYVAGIAGYTAFGTNCIIENCINEVVINSTSSFSGGIVGMVGADCTIKNCVNNAAISANGNSAGIVGGKAASGGTDTVTLINCINNGNITGLSTGTPGGLIGQITSYKFIIQNCANTGTVKQDTTLKSEIYGGTNATQNNKTYNNVIYLQGSGSGASGNSYYSIYASEIHAETTLSAIVSRLNSWITSQPADERGTYKKWKVSADGTKIVFEDEE